MKYLVFSIKTIFLGLFLYTLYFILDTSIFAISMDSSRFKVESANIEVTGGNKSSDSYKLADTVGQLAAGQYSSDGYIVRAGFQYIRPANLFRFSISNTNINFGTLVLGTPSIATTNLVVYFDQGQYQVTAIEEGPLKTQSENVIPDTSCDGDSNNTCSESLAKVWSSNLAYGFGYNMSGNDIPSDFINSTYFRPFPDQTTAEPPTTVMVSANAKKNRQATVTFKANISSIQPAGSYQTIINFVATPSY